MASMTEAVSLTGDYESGTPTALEKERKAELLGLKMVKSAPDLLLLDLDSDAHVVDFNVSLGIMGEAPTKLIKSYLLTTSKNGRKHAYVKLTRSFALLERIGFQAVLGSDRKRETLSVLELLKEYEEPTVLFETPEEHARVVAWIAK
jgi:hypothetical protein